jgi:hypothetical protein
MSSPQTESLHVCLRPQLESIPCQKHVRNAAGQKGQDGFDASTAAYVRRIGVADRPHNGAEGCLAEGAGVCHSHDSILHQPWRPTSVREPPARARTREAYAAAATAAPRVRRAESRRAIETTHASGVQLASSRTYSRQKSSNRSRRISLSRSATRTRSSTSWRLMVRRFVQVLAKRHANGSSAKSRRTPGTPGVGPRSRRPAGCPNSNGRWRPSLRCHLVRRRFPRRQPRWASKRHEEHPGQG